MPQRQPARRRFLLVPLGIVVVALLAFATLVGYFLLLGQQSEQGQQARMNELRLQSDEASTGWGNAADHDIDGKLPYEQLRVVATHNSYALQPTWLQRSVIDLVDPGEGALLKYEHAPLWDQLEAGVRSFELDIRWNGAEFSTSHVPLVANRTTVPDFTLALEEIKMWSDEHPGHIPLSIMIEPKSDYMFLDPTLDDFDAATWDALDAVLTDGLGEKLFTPDDLRSAASKTEVSASNSTGNAVDLREIVSASGWPQIDEMRDSVLLFLSDNELVREQYLSGYEGLAGRSVFTSSRTEAGDAVFSVRDDPTDVAIERDVSEAIIVRTRADADLNHSEALTRAALASGAQIISTDFPPSEPQQGTGYIFAFPGGALSRAGAA